MKTAEKGKRKAKSRHFRRAQLALLLGILLASAGILLLAHAADPPPAPSPTEPALAYHELRYDYGRGYSGDGWEVYFTQPDARLARADYVGGIDQALADAIAAAQSSLDVALFELNSDIIARALQAAAQRGLALRIVTDDAHGLQDERDSHLRDLQAAGIAVVDDGRSALMHNKFLIIDKRRVWTGSLNWTENGGYRNNNNVLVLTVPAIIEAYQAEFEEMFTRREFGAGSRDDGIVRTQAGGRRIDIVFGAEGDEVAAVVAELAQAQQSIHLMTFVLSLEELALAMLERAQAGVIVRGVFERRNSTQSWSQLPRLHCAGLAMRQDGNPYTMHHKVIIIDERTVITGSFNFSKNASRNNDENIVIVKDEDIASLYMGEWRRMWDSAQEIAPGALACD